MLGWGWFGFCMAPFGWRYFVERVQILILLYLITYIIAATIMLGILVFDQKQAIVALGVVRTSQ